MNLFDLQKNFWRLDEQESFSGNETRLYFFLLYLANRSYWSGWIEYADKKMVANANISLQVLKSAREKLKNAQLISFVTGGGFRVKTKYQILEPNSTPKLSSHNNINTKEKNNNTNTYGKKKGFIHSGSDFD